MPLCVVCGSKLVCSHPENHRSDGVSVDCAPKKAAIWVHVMDDRGVGLKDIEVTASGKKPSDDTGFLAFDPLEAGKYTVKLEDLSVDLAKLYDLPETRSRGVDLVQGEIAYLPFQLPRRATLKVKVAKKGDLGVLLDQAKVKITGDKGPTDERPTEVSGVVDFKERSADRYTIVVTELKDTDKKLFLAPDPKPWVLARGAKDEVLVEVIPLARPKIEVVWKGGKVEEVGVKLKEGVAATHDLAKTAKGTGLAELGVDAPGLKPGVEHEAVVGFDKKIYMADDSTLKHTFDEGFTGTKTVKLIKLARPRIKVIEETTKKEVDGIGVKLTGQTHGVVLDMGKTGKSGFAEIPAKDPGLRPDTYKIEIQADHYTPTLVSPLNVALDEGDTQTVILTVKTPKGALRVKIHRYDGLELPEKVDFKITRPGTGDVVNKTTDHRQVDVAREATGPTTVRANKANEDWLELPELVPDDYEVEIPDFDNKVLKKQGGLKPWSLGPAKDSKLKTTVKPGQTVEVEYTLTKYTKAQLIGFSVQPGFGKGYRCPKCFKAYVAKGTGKCTNGPCASADLKSKRCSKCGDLYDDGAATCASCAASLRFQGTDTYKCGVCNKKHYMPGKCTEVACAGTIVIWCKTCSDLRDDGGKCPLCDDDVVYLCDTSAKEFPHAGRCSLACAGTRDVVKVRPYKCLTCAGFFDVPGKCTFSGCTGDVELWCNDCADVRYQMGECPTCHKDIRYSCKVCNKFLRDPGLTRDACKHKVFDEELYLGSPTDEEDLLARCLVMKSAIKTAKDNGAKTDEDTLKIFVAPEFYFRGRNGAYRVDRIPIIQDQMRAFTKDADYKDWLFVYGTAIGYLPQTTSGDTEYKLKIAETAAGTTKIKVVDGTGPKPAKISVLERVPAENGQLPPVAKWKVKLPGEEGIVSVNPVVGHDDQREIVLANPVSVTKDDACLVVEPVSTEIFNVALLQRGGPDDGMAGMREAIVYKEKISHIDFLRSKKKLNWDKPEQRRVYLLEGEHQTLPTEGADEILGRGVNKVSVDKSEKSASGFGGGGVFHLDGVTIGLEVCLDHNKSRLKQFYDATPTGTGKVQVHLVPSWGASIDEDSLVGKAGTLIFNEDGPDGSELGKVTKIAPSGTYNPLNTAHTTAVPAPAKQDVKYLDSSTGATVEKEQKDVDPKLDVLFEEKDHEANRGKSGRAGKGLAWVDVYDPETLVDAEVV